MQLGIRIDPETSSGDRSCKHSIHRHPELVSGSMLSFDIFREAVQQNQGLRIGNLLITKFLCHL